MFAQRCLQTEDTQNINFLWFNLDFDGGGKGTTMHYKAEIAYTAPDGKYWPEKTDTRKTK